MSDIGINEAAKIADVKPHTLRYYESIGLIKNIKRDALGKRVYNEQDLKWLEFINRLRLTGMKISKMKEYTRLRNLGDETIKERKNILYEHLADIESQINGLLEVKEYVVKKISIYNDMEEKHNESRK
jgi:Predicted transcriptional regulators